MKYQMIITICAKKEPIYFRKNRYMDGEELLIKIVYNELIVNMLHMG